MSLFSYVLNSCIDRWLTMSFKKGSYVVFRITDIKSLSRHLKKAGGLENQQYRPIGY